MSDMPTETAAKPADPADTPQQRPLTADVSMTFANKAAVLVFNIGATIVVARTLGPAGRGAIAVAFSVTLLLIQFGSFGLQSANPYFIARDRRTRPQVVANSLWLSLVIGLALIAIGIVVKAFFPGALRDLDWLDVLVVLVGIPAALASTLLQSVLLAEGRMIAYNAVESGFVIVNFIGLTIGLVVLDFGVTAAISLMVALNIAAAITFFVLVHEPGSPLVAFSKKLTGRMLRYGFRIYVATLIAYAVGRVNLVLVNAYLGSTAAGQYSVGVALADGMHLLPSVVALNLFARVARGEQHERSAAVFRTLSLLFALLCLLTVPVAGPAIRLLYGQAFSPATDIYYWLLPGIFAYGMLSVLAYHFAGRGFPLEAMLIWFPGMVVNLAIVMLFVPSRGPNVAALSATVSYVLILLMHMRMFAKESGGYGSLIPRPREAFQLTRDAWRALRSRPAT